MELHRVRPSELSSAFELLVSNGWRERLGDLGKFESLVKASQIAEVAVLDGEGFEHSSVAMERRRASHGALRGP